MLVGVESLKATHHSSLFSLEYSLASLHAKLSMETTIQVPRWTPTPSPTSSPRGPHVPRWAPSPSPPSSPKGAMKSESFEPNPPSSQERNQVPRWNPNEPMQSENIDDLEKWTHALRWGPNTSSPRGPMQDESFQPSSPKGTHVPKWNQSPSQPSSPKRRMRNENFDELELEMGTHLPTWTQHPIPPSSPKGAMKNESLELRPSSSPRASHVPRWTPSPSSSSSPKGPTRNQSFDDLEKGSVASEEDMSSDMQKFFPFNSASISSSTRPPPDSLLLEAPSLRNLPKVKTSSKQKPAVEPKQNKNKVTWTNIDHTDFTSKSNGVFLTWEDLWVTVPDRQSGRRPILQRLTGYAQPGETLAIMGPSGCGKSTLLDALAGRLGSNTRQAGEILINGRKQRLAFGTSAYVTQDDTLMTTLTVREAVHYSAQLQLPGSMPTSAKKERAEMTICEMGLQDCIDTRIGGWGKKGLSGGQKRRVSICIEILTRPKLLFLDEPTSGLDSAASYHVMDRIVKLTHRERITVIASIHQPSSEVFELFHNLCLLSSGKTVYFGPASMANQFFASNGFPCPALRNPSDHFLRTINKDFDLDIEQGLGGATSTEEAINILVRAYKLSETCQQVQGQVSEICQQNGGVLEKKGSQASFATQCLVLTKRSFVNMYRDLGYYWLRLAIYIALCLCVGTIFYDIGFSYGSIQARGSMLMFVAAFLTFMAIGGFPSFVEDMKIFGRERLNGHYGVGAFVVGNTFSSIPYLLLISLIPGAMAYYLVHLQKGFEHFVYFALLLFVCMMLVESLMMMVASIVPDFLMGIITGAGIQGVMMLCGGFFRLPNDLPNPFWKYPMYYIAFHKYANQGFYKNEFEGLTFPNNQVGGAATITGEEILHNVWQVEMGYSKWIDLAILFGMVVLYRLMFLGIIKTVEKVKPMIRGLFVVPPEKSKQIVENPIDPQYA